MSAKVVSTADPTLHLCSRPNQSSKKPIISSVSFSSQVTKSRISIRNPSGPWRTRATARIAAFYAPADAAETLYELLGITDQTGSSFSDIKKAYKQMARKYHPDVSPPDRVDEYTRRFILVHEAYETLSNPQSRALYDRDLAGGLGFSFSARIPHQQYHQGMEEIGEWKTRWQSQLNELKRRDCRGKMSWGSRMRNQRR